MKSQDTRRSRAIAGADDVVRRFTNIAFLALLAAAMIFASAAGAATTDGKERRVALVIGNSAYQFTPALPNPTNDAEAMAAALQRLGFEVAKGIDLDRAETELIIRDFTRKLPGADVALFFYAGHGIQVARQNYLIPVDAQLADETDLHFEATDLNLVLGLMEREPRVNLVFLDACRDNPLSQKLARSMGSTRSTAIGRGLALVDAPDGSYIAFATQPDNVALDGEGNHSPFTAALLNHIETPGLSLSDMMIRVRNDVKATTNGQQVPKEESSLTSTFYFQPALSVEDAIASVEPAAGPATTVETTTSGVDKEVVFWDSIKDSSSPGQFEAYLAQFPNGTFAPLARVRLEELKAARTAEATAATSDQVATLTTQESDEAAPEQVERSIGLTRQGRSRVQLALTLLGYSTGGTDGVLGPKSRAAISAWQTDQGEAATGYLTSRQHAALLDAAGPKLTAWDAEQKRIAAERAQQEAAAAAAAKNRQTQPSSYATTAKSAQDAAAQAELERQKKENEELKKALAEQQAKEKEGPDMNIGIGIGGAIGSGGGVGIFPSLSIFN
jgi:uncharacterized caspase-like protein